MSQIPQYTTITSVCIISLLNLGSKFQSIWLLPVLFEECFQPQKLLPVVPVTDGFIDTVTVLEQVVIFNCHIATAELSIMTNQFKKELLCGILVEEHYGFTKEVVDIQ